MNTRETLIIIRLKLAEALLEKDTEKVQRLLNALLQAYKDHVTTLEREITERKLRERYRVS